MVWVCGRLDRTRFQVVSLRPPAGCRIKLAFFETIREHVVFASLNRQSMRKVIMVSEIEKRRLDLERMSPDEFAAEYQRVFGEGVAPTYPDKAVSAILHKEFGAKRKVYFSDKCEYCGMTFPAAATPLERDVDGKLRYEVQCKRCGKWTITYGQDREDLARNFEIPDDSDYSGLDG